MSQQHEKWDQDLAHNHKITIVKSACFIIPGSHGLWKVGIETELADSAFAPPMAGR